MTYEEIKHLFQYDENESKIFLPNEIFDDLTGNVTKNSLHLTFSYSYIYLTTWMYRYAKHISVTNGFIDNGKVKEILGYNATTKGLDYMTKKNGLLDQLGYTKTVKDFPTHWTYDEFEGIEFGMYSSYKDYLSYLNLSRKFNIKLPVKAIHRYNNEVLDGTYYEFENTHSIPFEVFMFCIANDKLGTTGFYLYSYIKRMNDMFPDGWDVAFDKLAKVTGVPASTLERYMDELRRYNMIIVKYNQEVFSLAMRLEDRKACTYIINEFNQFIDTPQKIKKMKVITTKEYFKNTAKENIHIWGKKAEITEELLPY
ncbi:hypothetical protein [Neobacillus cucumis]|uniref:hypothetical protein n=1 Tax=Neobacillus cucumis TaxID=1740721 RepID=UPI002E2466D3|nr:hypothetical protein [Neobacillus cucumis]